MANLKNKVNLIGRIGKDLELSTYGKNGKFCRFPIAVNERMKDQKGNWVDDTQWFNIVAFGKTAENLANYARKGMEITMEARLKNNQFEDKDGKKHYSTEIYLDDYYLSNYTKEENKNINAKK